MKVLIVNKHISQSLGGSEMQCDLIANGLTKLGHEIIYAAVSDNAEAIRAPYKVINLNLDQKDNFSNILQSEKPEIVYWRYNKNHFHKSVLDTKKAGIPFVFAVSHIQDLKKFGYKNRKRSFIKTLPKIIMEMASSFWNYRGFHYASGLTTLNGQYLNLAPVRNKIKIWNAVDATVIPFEWGRPYCAWVANIKSSKRPEIYIDLAKYFCKKYPDIDFLMIGKKQTGAYDVMISEAAAQYSNFKYLGPKSSQEVNGILRSARCMIHTCKPEGFGNNFIQSWFQGCPTITYEFDPDLLIKNECLGYVSGSMKQLIADTETLILDADLRSKIGERAKSFAIRNFTPTILSINIERFLKEIIDNFYYNKNGAS